MIIEFMHITLRDTIRPGEGEPICIVIWVEDYNGNFIEFIRWWQPYGDYY